MERPLGENEKLYIALDVANALEFLHTKGVAHRQVAEENVLVKDPASISVKLAGHFAARVVYGWMTKKLKACAEPQTEQDPCSPRSRSGSNEPFSAVSKTSRRSFTGLSADALSLDGSIRKGDLRGSEQRAGPDPRTADIMGFG